MKQDLMQMMMNAFDGIAHDVVIDLLMKIVFSVVNVDRINFLKMKIE